MTLWAPRATGITLRTERIRYLGQWHGQPALVLGKNTMLRDRRSPNWYILNFASNWPMTDYDQRFPLRADRFALWAGFERCVS